MSEFGAPSASTRADGGAGWERPGSLCVVGTGIQLIGQVTLESESAIRSATKLFYLVTDPPTKRWLTELNDSAEDLVGLYDEGKLRIETYNAMVERLLDSVRSGEDVCVAFYGHPGVFVYPGHEAIRRARAEGYRATMFPGVSAEDCLFADLSLDPGTTGCQSFEATDFLVYSRKFDEHVPLILWQVSSIGQLTHELKSATVGLEVLASHLSMVYGPDHEVIIYEAARYPLCEPLRQSVTLEDLPGTHVSGIATLVVPPLSGVVADPQMIRRLGIPESYLVTKGLAKRHAIASIMPTPAPTSADRG